MNPANDLNRFDDSTYPLPDPSARQYEEQRREHKRRGIITDIGESEMTKQDRHGSPTFYHLLEEAAQTHHAKSHDYASNDNPYGNYHFAGQLANIFSHSHYDAGFVGRIAEKIYRLANLEKAGKTPKNESVEDTEKDILVIVGLWMADRRDRRRVAVAQTTAAYGTGAMLDPEFLKNEQNKKEALPLQENASQRFDNIGVEIIKLTNQLPLARLRVLNNYITSVCHNREL